MRKLDLPIYDNNELSELEINFEFNRPANLPLVVWSNNISQKKKDALELICGINNFPYQELIGDDVMTIDRNLEATWESYQTNSILIVGDYLEFPPMKFQTRFGVHYSDFIYADVGNEGSADVGIGRVFGSIQTISKHLQMRIGDSNRAVLFDTDPVRSSATIEAVKALGFDLDVLSEYREDNKSMLEDAELILQVSDGVSTERIHGTPMEWASHNGKIMDYNDFSTLEFKNYPLIFSEACSTVSYGPLLTNILKAGGMYYGATSPSFNNPKEYSNWRACSYCDGIKIGLLDVMDEVSTIGQVVRELNQTLFESLSASQQDLLSKALKNPLIGETIADPEIETILQFNLFGNPDRPIVVGVDPDYDAGVIHFDT